MRKSRKFPNIDPSEVPEHIKADLNNPQLWGLGNSKEPRDNIWIGYDGAFHIEHGLSLDRDPEDALRQIVEAIVASRLAAPSGKNPVERIDKGVAAILGVNRNRGPKTGSAKVDRHDVARRAAHLVYERHLDSSMGLHDWRSCLWDALNEKERHIFKERESEKFSNFYNATMQWLAEGEREEKLLFEVSVHDRETGGPICSSGVGDKKSLTALSPTFGPLALFCLSHPIHQQGNCC